MEPRSADIQWIASLVTNAPAAVIHHFSVRAFEYDAYLPGRILTRIEGRATVDGQERGWSVIRKWTDAATETPKAPLEGRRREALAYRSRIADVVRGFAMPIAHEIKVSEGGPVELWLEDVVDDQERWPLTTFAVAARALGRFNGTWAVRPVPPRRLARDGLGS
jgi:hypothetical protein